MSLTSGTASPPIATARRSGGCRRDRHQRDLAGNRADEARRAAPTTAALRRLCGALVIARRRGATAPGQSGSARTEVLSRIGDAEADGCTVADDGTVSAPDPAVGTCGDAVGRKPQTATICWKFAPKSSRAMHSALGALAASDNGCSASNRCGLRPDDRS